MKLAISANPWAFIFASDKIKTDKEIIKQVVKTHPSLVTSPITLSVIDAEFFQELVKINPKINQYPYKRSFNF